MARDADHPPLAECDDLVIERSGHGSAQRAVDGVSILLEQGQLIGISGNAGSGKSTLVATLAGEEKTTRIIGGRAKICGTDVRARGRAGRIRQARIGWVPQSASAILPAQWTVAEYVAQPIVQRDRRANRRALALRIATLLDELHLPLGAGEKFPFELSAGMRQRVAIAHALVMEPRILIADELLANLDPAVQPVVVSAVRRRAQERGMGALLAMSDATVLSEIGASIIVLRAGNVVGRGDGDAVRWAPDYREGTE